MDVAELGLLSSNNLHLVREDLEKTTSGIVMVSSRESMFDAPVKITPCDGG